MHKQAHYILTGILVTFLFYSSVAFSDSKKNIEKVEKHLSILIGKQSQNSVASTQA